MKLVTERLILRPWEETDAEELYRYAKDPAVGPIAGWPPHVSVEDSLQIIRNVLSAPETYAVVLKSTKKPIGSVGIMFGENGSAPMKEQEAEIGYWVGVPFWGQGLIPEAVRELQRRCFEELGCHAVWCGYYNDNYKSKRVQEKCGFLPHHMEENKISPMGDLRTEHFTYLTKEQWLFSIREVEPADANTLLSIYTPYVEETAISFEYEVPKEEEFAERIRKIKEKYPYLAAVEKGKITGYAYAAPFKQREAYDWSVETTIYVDREHRGQGTGKHLYLALEERLKKQHIQNMYACIASTETEDNYLTNDSERFHAHLGFRTVGRFSKCGYKFENWYDMIWMEKMIGEHDVSDFSGRG